MAEQMKGTFHPTIISVVRLALLFVPGYWGLVDARANQELQPAVSVGGMLSYQEMVSNAPVGYRQEWPFTVVSDKLGRWQISVNTRMPNPQLPIESTQYLAYDGTNIYAVTYSPQVVVTRPGSPPKLMPATEKTGAAQITAGRFPTDYGGAIGIIWLAFFGGRDLNVSNQSVRFPNLTVGNARTDPLAWSCKLEYELVSKFDSKLISSGRFVLNPDWLRSSPYEYPELDEPDNDNVYDRFKDLTDAYRELPESDRVRSIYILDSSNLIGQVLIPAKFHVELNQADNPQHPFHIEGYVTNAVSTNIADVMPPLVGLINVHDHRFHFKTERAWRGDAHYTLANDVWLVDTNDSRIKTALGRTPMRPLMTSSATVIKHRGIQIFLLIAFIIPVPIVLLLYWQRHSHDTSAG